MKKRTLTAIIATTLMITPLGITQLHDIANPQTAEAAQYSFKKNTVKIRDLKLKITKMEVIEVGAKGNEYGKKPVLAIWYNTTNYTNKKIDPTSAWMAVFNTSTPVQDTDKSQVNVLKVGTLPDEKFSDTQTETIKKNQTASNAISYELDSKSVPVKLTAHKGDDGPKLGTKTIKLSKLTDVNQ